MASKPEMVPGPLSEEDARAICGWRYPEPYDRYCWPPYDKLKKHGRELGDPDIRRAQYLAVRDGNNALIAYLQLFPLDRAVRIGLGLRPDLCDQGLGPTLASLAAQEAARRRPGAEIDLEVEQWNKRAVRAYEKAGFAISDEYVRIASHGEVPVYCMVWNND